MEYKETERKFLVRGEYKSSATKSSHIIQAYLNTDPDRTVRVRIRDGRAWISVKGRNDGATRFEWEKEIGVDEAEALLPLCEPGTIDKTRYIVPFKGHDWEVDEFSNGLTLAEIELSDENEEFARPDWVAEEVTGDPRYYNSNISRA